MVKPSWEYCVYYLVNLEGNPGNCLFQKRSGRYAESLESLGKEGWELCGHAGSGSSSAYIFKRAENPLKTRLVQFILDYGAVDGAHHKQYVLDQVLRKLTGDNYDYVIKEWCNGEDGPDTYTWDEGTAP